MQKLLIATHGHMASGIKSSIQILTGLQDQVVALDAYVDDVDYRQGIKEFIDQAHGQPCVILTDIVGGSVAQAAIVLSKGKKNVFIVCGVNLPIVLSLLMNTQVITESLITQLINDSQVQLLELNTENNDNTCASEDFFNA
ncbi:PTS sugar transporter subunit IIA [Lapidilactobacillus bayanensis]|uniref:PTS sugar transporter subunit IIA n=1 Tax=Lapidilactobacillus bayanensis TaxID=2485998 RepID=UPI000F7BA43D|nr:PTS sugar transporter subunit IIA [Lapidilactobacillus bayanensis]